MLKTPVAMPYTIYNLSTYLINEEKYKSRQSKNNIYRYHFFCVKLKCNWKTKVRPEKTLSANRNNRIFFHFLGFFLFSVAQVSFGVGFVFALSEKSEIKTVISFTEFYPQRVVGFLLSGSGFCWFYHVHSIYSTLNW